MSRDSFGQGVDNSCVMCGCPCGYPCADCGHGMRAKRDGAPVQRITPWSEYHPLTDAERADIDEQDRAAMERAELQESYQ